jgi:hypothetical protein
MIEKIKFIFQNWKLFIHLMFRTYHFGVNNEWYSSIESIFGMPVKQRFKYNQIKQNIMMMKIRGFDLYFLAPPEREVISVFKKSFKK